MIKAIFFDLGDTLVVEESVEDKHSWGMELQKVPYVDQVLHELKKRYKLGIITNTVTFREEHVELH